MMTEFDSARERVRIKNELVNVRFNISVKKREIAVLQLKESQLENRLQQLAILEETRRVIGLMELVRMCNTPCWRWRPMYKLAKAEQGGAVFFRS